MTAHGWAALLLAAAAAIACRGQIRFDDHPADGGAAADGCRNDRCGFVTEHCGRDGCELECHEGDTCAGSCGPSCLVECESEARCSITIGEDSTVHCGADARCTVQCQGPCTLFCGSRSTCSLACAGEATPRPVSGMVTCP
jgi:hypothetical protein